MHAITLNECAFWGFLIAFLLAVWVYFALCNFSPKGHSFPWGLFFGIIQNLVFRRRCWHFFLLAIKPE